MLHEDFDFDSEIALLEAAGAGPEKYLMHANAHSMAASKYMAACKSTAGGMSPARKKLMRALGRKHKAAAEALSAIANHHVDATFKATDGKRQALRNPGMTKQSMNESVLEEAKLLKHSDGWYSVRRTNHYALKHSVEHLDDHGNWISDKGIIHSSDWHGIRHSNKDKAMANAKKHGVEIKEGYEMETEVNEGYTPLKGTTEEQTYLAKHITKGLGAHKVHVNHSEQGGINIYSKHHGHPGNNAHVKEMAGHLGKMGVPHRLEGNDDTSIHYRKNRHKLYILSNDAHDHGKRIKDAEKAGKPLNSYSHWGVHEETDMEDELNPTGDLIKLAILNKPYEFQNLVYEMLVGTAQDRLEDLRVAVQESLVADADDSDEDSEDEGEAEPEIEEETQIDELGPGTLGRYIHHATRDAEHQENRKHQARNMSQNLSNMEYTARIRHYSGPKGRDYHNDRGAGETAQSDLRDVAHKHTDAVEKDASKRLWNRSKGIHRAIDKLDAPRRNASIEKAKSAVADHGAEHHVSKWGHHVIVPTGAAYKAKANAEKIHDTLHAAGFRVSKHKDDKYGHHVAVDHDSKKNVREDFQDGAYLSKAGEEASHRPTVPPCPMQKEKEPAGKRFPTGRQLGDRAMKKLGQVNKGVKGSPGMLGDEDRLENSRN